MGILSVLWVIVLTTLAICFVAFVYALVRREEEVWIPALVIGIISILGLAILEIVENSIEDGARDEACAAACGQYAVLHCGWIGTAGPLEDHGLAVCGTEDNDKLEAAVLDVARD